ncbi:MAG: phytanoyl-CoA dioxygenase family protein [Caldilinea sp.]|jgi:ectoine hydroxylase-related dioxygenase (phytanoyl-CoA dioxygenase family)
MEILPRERPLRSNGFVLASQPERLGPLTPTPPGQPIEALREQYAAQGYLWLKELIDPALVWEFRSRYFAALAHTGLLAAGSNPRDGIYAGGGEDKRLVTAKTVEIARWAAYEALCLSRPIVDFYEAFFDAPVYLHKRMLIRFTRPHDPACTGAHYDLVYLRAGTDELCTSWIPLGEIPVEMGGLVYLEGSDRWGRRMEAEFALKNADLSPEERLSAYNRNMNEGGWLTKNLPELADRLATRWLIADYAAGDMVVHSPYMIHASTLNENPHGVMRLSTDIRFQRASDTIDPRWQNHWHPDDEKKF